MFPPTHPGCFTDCRLQAHQQTQQAVGSGSGTDRTDHPWGCRASGSSKGKGRGVLSSRWERGELAPPPAPLSSLLPPQEGVAAGGPQPSPSWAWVGGQSGSRGPSRGHSRTPCP